MKRKISDRAQCATLCAAVVFFIPMAAYGEDHRVCVEWTWLGGQFGFRDVSPRPDVDLTNTPDYGTYGEDAEEDYGRRDPPTDFAPRRMLALVEDGENTLWGWNFLDDGGCTGVFDTSASEVTFTAVPWSKWSSSGNEVVVLDCVTGDCVLPQVSDFLAVNSGILDIDYDTAGIGIGWSFAVHWVMSFSEWRRAYNSNQLFYGTVWSLGADIGDAVSNNLVGGRPTSNFKAVNDPLRSKLTISHEYGHLQTVGVLPRLPVVPDETQIDSDRTDDSPASVFGSNYAGAGTAVERDWAYFLWDLVNGMNPLDIDDVMLWLVGYWNESDMVPGWPKVDETSDWWDGFDAYAKTHPVLTMAESGKFDAGAGGTGGRDIDQ